MMTTTTATQWIPWAPLAAASMHVTEEFVFPGGFMRWYRGYRGPAVESITPRFLVIMNALMLGSCLWLGLSMEGTVGVAYWLLMAGILASNGVWHVYASLRSRTYSPGLVTGTLVYIPLAALGLAYFARTGADMRFGLPALALGALYPAWSHVFHSRHRAKPAQVPVP